MTSTHFTEALHHIDATFDVFVEGARIADRDECAIKLAALIKLRQSLSVAIDAVEAEVIAKADEKDFVVEGLGTVEVKRKTKRTAWQKDDLRRAVLDSILVNPDTGEIIAETPVQKIEAVWNLGAPRVTALRERGLQPDEFCTEEPDGWGVKLP